MDIKKIYLSSEGRLPRLKFFLYLLLLGVVFFVINLILGAILPQMAALIVSAVLQFALVFFVYPHLITKRQHDRNSDGKAKVKWVLTVFVLTYAVSLVSNIVKLNSLGSMQTEAQDLVQQLQTATTTGEQEQIYAEIQTLSQKAISKAFSPLNIALLVAMIGLSIWSIVLWWPLLFNAGTKWHNHYGADPLEKK